MVSFDAEDPQDTQIIVYIPVDYAGSRAGNHARLPSRRFVLGVDRFVRNPTRETRQKDAIHSRGITDQVKQGAIGNRGYPGRGEPLSQKAPTRLPNSNAKR